jgi:3-oxoacyl-[acyl-carrier-protein] synthase-3
MGASIIGLGQWLPETVRENSAWPAEFGRSAEMTELTDVTAGESGDAFDRIVARHVASEHGDPFLGSKRRRVAPEGMTACEAEAHASRAALADAGIEAGEVDMLMSWAIVPDRLPSGAPWVAHEIGATKAIAMSIDAACASTIAQVMLATAMVESGRAKFVLLTQSHLATRTFPFAHPASPNVGDAATAMVVGASTKSNILSTFGVSHGEYYDAVVWRRSKEDRPWYEPGGPMYLGSYAREAARRLIQDTVRFGAATVEEAAKRAGMDVSDLDVIASVQPRRWVPGAIAEALGLPEDRAPQTFEDLAHLGGCGVVTNLIAARERASSRSFVAALYAQGAGFTRAAAVVRFA